MAGRMPVLGGEGERKQGQDAVDHRHHQVALGNRQAVAFMVANIATELDAIRLVTLRGASRAEQGLSFAREAALSRKLTIDKGLQIGLDGVQLLGGHGFTKEHPVERWYRDLRGAGIGEGIVVL